MVGTVTGWPLCLWHGGLSLTHPATGELVSFEASEPAFFQARSDMLPSQVLHCALHACLCTGELLG